MPRSHFSNTCKIFVQFQFLSLVPASVVSSLLTFNFSYLKYSPPLLVMAPSSGALKHLSASSFTVPLHGRFIGQPGLAVKSLKMPMRSS